MTPFTAIQQALLGCQPPDHKAGLFLYDLICTYDLSQTMEVGALHKATAIYASAAHLQKRHGTHLVVDYDSSLERTESIQRAARDLNSGSHCIFDLSPVSLHWRLLKLLSKAEQFDLCFLVGRQTWSHAGFAALLALRLLRPGGWIVLGDAGYVYANDTTAPEYLTSGMSEEELRAPQVDLVFSQLLANDSLIQHPVKVGKLFAARKRAGPEARQKPAAPMKVAAAIDTAYHRTIFDPDFRRKLLDFPGEVLSMLTGATDDETFASVHFYDRPANRLVIPPESRGDLHLILPEPVWQAARSEQELEALIALAETEQRSRPPE